MKIGTPTWTLRLKCKESRLQHVRMRTNDEYVILVNAILDLTLPYSAPSQLVEVSSLREQHIADTHAESIEKVLRDVNFLDLE